MTPRSSKYSGAARCSGSLSHGLTAASPLLSPREQELLPHVAELCQQASYPSLVALTSRSLTGSSRSFASPDRPLHSFHNALNEDNALHEPHRHSAAAAARMEKLQNEPECAQMTCSQQPTEAPQCPTA